MLTIRPAQLSDLDAITEIYNEAIRTGTATFDIESKTPAEQLRWFDSHGPKHPILVADFEGTVVGWACLSPWSERAAYSAAVETSFYVKEEHRGQGVGRALKQAIVEAGRQQGHHALIALVTEGSDESIHLNESLGFVRIGTLKEVGRKFGRLLDVHIYQKLLD